MRKLTGGGMHWLRGVWQRSREIPVGPREDEGVLLPVTRALALLESRVCDGVVHRPAAWPSAGHARRLDAPGAAPVRNAFGRSLREEQSTGPREAVVIAQGMTLGGLRATAFLEGDELLAAHESLRDAAERLVPLVLHAGADAGHAAYHMVAGSGCFQALAGSGQEALDLSLVARWLAERALVPGLLASDGDAVERLALPDDALVRAYLGEPEEPIASPTEAQRLLFGRERARLLRWFDVDRPVGTGGRRGALDAAQSRTAQRHYYADALRELARQGMDELSGLTGRPLSFVREHRLADAQLVLVAQGAVAASARAVADRLRESRGWRVGVLGITWLRPFPSAEVAQALRGRRAVAVVEALNAPLGAPLLREVELAAGSFERIVSATCAGGLPEPARLAELCAQLQQAEPPRHFDLDRVRLPESSGFPRRDALLQSVAHGYPELWPAGDGDAPGASAELRADPPGGRAVALLGLEAALPPDALEQLCDVLVERVGPHVCGGVCRPEPGALELRLRAAADAFGDPGTRAPVGALLIAADPDAALGDPLQGVSDGGLVLVASAATLPAAWHDAALTRDLKVYATAPGFAAGLAALGRCLAGETDALIETGELRSVTRPEPSALADAEPPALASRIKRVRPEHDSLPRFWGEVAQPRRAGARDGLPDPLSASGVVPAGASALLAHAAPGMLPLLDPEKCSGCGRCWTVCPESALGVTALGTEQLLSAASQLAGTQGPVADAARRAHKHLAGRVDAELLRRDGQIDAELLGEAWSWLAQRMTISDDERPEHERVVEATFEAACQLDTVRCDTFFSEPERENKGDGELLMLAVDPATCVSCGLCVAECPEQALTPAERTPQRVEQLARRWRCREELPDTTGATLARAARHPEVGELAAILMSRHCAQSQLGAAGGEPGSGERLASRLVTAVVEQHAQRHLARRIRELGELRAVLQEKLDERIGESFSGTAPDTLAQALGGLAHDRLELVELGSRLDALGSRATFDRPAALRMASASADLGALQKRLAEGVDGLGRARFGVLVVDGEIADWAARFPRHPYFAPLTLARPAQAVELARGLAHGLVAEHLRLVRALRRAKLEAESPHDRSERAELIEAATWQDLAPEERAACPPLLILGDETALVAQGMGALTRLLDTDLPVKVVLLDGRGRLAPGPEPAVAALAQRRAFVLAASPAFPGHLARGLADALDWPGPALVHLHAPSPRRHGFPADATLRQARLAVEGRAHVLLRYDPRAAGVFGLRASLDGNPAPEQAFGDVDYAGWAAREERFAEHFRPLAPGEGTPLHEWLGLAERARADAAPVVEVEGRRLGLSPAMAAAAAERLDVWNTLRELCGVASPFTERIRDSLAQEIEAEQRVRLEELTQDYEGRISGLRADSQRDAQARLTDRLMVLAGYAASQQPKGNGA